MENTTTFKKLETVDVVAPMLKMSKQALYEAIRRGLVPAVRIGTRIRINLDVLENWLECGGSPWCDRKRGSYSNESTRNLFWKN